MKPKFWYIMGGTFAALSLLAYSQKQRIKNFIQRMSKADFIKLYLPEAAETEKATGVPKEVTLAQAGLESAWGGAVYGNNFFGIKADKNYSGPIQFLKTWEFGKTGVPTKDGINDKIIRIYPPGDPEGKSKTLYSYRVLSRFRKYPTVKEGFKDHANFLRKNPRYKNAFLYSNDPKAFASEIAAAGYATAPNYATSLHSIIDLIKTVTT